MIAAEQFRQFNDVVVALAHLFPIDRDHIVMYPVTNRSQVIANSTLCNLAFMMRKQKVHPAAMYIKLLTQTFCAHCGAFNMPARKTNAPGTLPIAAHSFCLSLLNAGFDEEFGKLMPSASMAEAMVLAVYMPPHAPAPGQACWIIALKSASLKLPAIFFPSASNALTIFKSSSL